MKKLIVQLLVVFSTVCSAADTYDSAAGKLHIPKVVVGDDVYEVDMLHQGNYMFEMTKATRLAGGSSIVGSWGNGHQNNGDTGWLTITFYPSNLFIIWEDDPGSCRGVQIGEYQYDSNNKTLMATKYYVDELSAYDCGLPNAGSGMNGTELSPSA